MKKLYVIAAAVLVASCGMNQQKVTLNQEAAELNEKLEAIFNNADLSGYDIERLTDSIYNAEYVKHHDDSLGLSIFKNLLTNYWSSEKSLEEYEKASELVKTNDLINTKIESIKHAEDVKPGMDYIDISGPNAMTGETLSISDILKEGKPVLVDFWASWCSPCRQEIKSHLLAMHDSGKVNIIGIAVWEDSIDDTKKAMEDSGIKWPVIFTGGRKDSPSIKYGVLGIPTLFLISPDGKIMESAHSVEDMDFFKEQ